jgi:DNA-binding CsgD family transcriptional regulator/tetratricopeptide (TPR) repeat protein
MPSSGPVGREEELGEVDAFLDRVPCGLAVLALTGPAGIGKTTVWREAVRRAEARGYLVLAARPAQTERAMSFSGLADLLAPVRQEAFDALVPVQRLALDVALLRAEAGPQPLPGRAAPAALFSLVRGLAADRPLLVAVDDAQWLDDATAESLPYALRRAEALAVGVLVSVRTEGGRPPTFENCVPADRRREVEVGPLSVGALHAVVKGQLQHSLPRPTLVRVAMSCGGNPFYALEIARELERVGAPRPGEPLPVPGELQALVRSRMSRLPARTREALLTAACLSQPSIDDVGAEAIGPAEEAGILHVERDGRLRFAHPLLASAVRDSASAARRQSVHRRLAERLTDPQERARHLAAAATGPDESVAAMLDAAAEQAVRRGAVTTASELFRQAIELTEDISSVQAARRAIRFEECCVQGGGDPAEPRSVLEATLSACGDPELRAELRLYIARCGRNEGRAAEFYPVLLTALSETRNPVLAARLHYQAVWMAQDDPVHGLRHCDAAWQLLDEASDPGLYSSLILQRAYLQLISGAGADDAAIERGKEIEDRIVQTGYTDRSPVPVIWPLLKDQLSAAVAVHAEHLEWSRQVGKQALEQSLAYFLVLLELWRGDWPEASRWAAALTEMVEQSGDSQYWFSALLSRGQVDAHAGRLAAAEAAYEQAVAIAIATSDRGREAEARQLMGFVALSRRDLKEAACQLIIADHLIDELGQREPARYRFHPDLIEALIGLGDLSAAQAQVDRLAHRGRVLPRPWTLATGARCRGLMLAAAGDLDGADAAMRAALEHHENLEMPFERGRTQLAYGQILRRRNERRHARVMLTAAVSVFDELGALIWADLARGELRRIPIRRVSADLTATEERIARLAAAGLTNREIAGQAFVSLKTVEANLSRAYAKLSVRSRAQLVQAMAARNPPAQ